MFYSQGFASDILFKNHVPANALAQGYARFPEFLQNFTERQILWCLCSVDFLTFTLKLPIQTLLSVVPILPYFARSGEKCQKFSKTSTSREKMSSIQWPIFRLHNIT